MKNGLIFVLSLVFMFPCLGMKKPVLSSFARGKRDEGKRSKGPSTSSQPSSLAKKRKKRGYKKKPLKKASSCHIKRIPRCGNIYKLRVKSDLKNKKHKLPKDFRRKSI